MKNFILLTLLVLSLFGDDYEFCEQPEKYDPAKGKINIEDVKNDASKKSMERWLNGNFALETYKVNYILPYGYSNKAYKPKGPLHYDNIEAELQVSLKLRVGQNLFGLHESYYVSYSHQSFWQIYIKSAPFRETNYNPEGFVIIPINDTTSMFQLRSVKLAIAHKSNGQPNTENVDVNGVPLGNLSKSINYVYTTIRAQHKTHIIDLTFLAPMGTGDNLSDNPDLMDYWGYSKIKFTYFYHEHMFTLMARGNLRTGKGAAEATYSYPLEDNTNLYVKLFSGYSESLIDYNRNLNKAAIGFSFSR